MEGAAPWIIFAVASTAVVLAGWQLGKQGDRISEQTGLGGLWVGVVLVASVTSLPEVVTGMTAAAIKEPGLAAGDLFGSSMANMAILAIIDLAHRQRRVLRSVSQGHSLVALLAIALTAMAAMFILEHKGPAVWHVGTTTLLLGAIYLLGTRVVLINEYVAALARIAERALKREEENEEQSENAEEPRPGLHFPSREAALVFGGAAAVVLASAPFMTGAAQDISEQTGLEASFVGVVMLAIVTSAPELISSISAIRVGAHDLAVGNLFGSNCFNMFAFVFVDVAYTDGPIFSAISNAELVAAMMAMFLMATAMMGIVSQSERRIWLFEPDALAILVAYGAGLYLVYEATG